MLIAGLTGGMGCGKSFVADALRKLGAYVIEADALGHECLLSSGAAYSPVVGAFGEEILTGAEIDRKKLAAKVFGNPEALEKLNSFVHPAVRAAAKKQIADIAARDPKAVIFYVAAILIETGAIEGMQKLVVVTCTPEQQVMRAAARTGASEEAIRARLKHQLPMAEKAARADYIIDASGTEQDTLRQTKIVFEELRRLAG